MSSVALGFSAVLAGIGLIYGVLCVAKRLLHRWHNSHPGLFSSLCRLHHLERNSRRLLKQVAQHHRLAQPGRIFIEPEWLDPARLGPPLRGRAVEVAVLRDRLFDLADPCAG